MTLFAQIYRVSIVVYKERCVGQMTSYHPTSVVRDETDPDRDTLPTLHLLFRGNNHYDSLIDFSAPRKKSPDCVSFGTVGEMLRWPNTGDTQGKENVSSQCRSPARKKRKQKKVLATQGTRPRQSRLKRRPPAKNKSRSPPVERSSVILVPSAPGKKTRGAPTSKSGTGPVVSGINFESPIAYVKTMGLPEEVLHTAERIVKASPDDLGDVQQCL